MGSLYSITAEDRHKHTPEHRLWFQVLTTYVHEARNKCKPTDKKCRQGKMQIRSDINHPWTKFICEMIDYDYATFKKRVLAILGESCPIHDKRTSMTLRSAGS